MFNYKMLLKCAADSGSDGGGQISQIDEAAVADIITRISEIVANIQALPNGISGSKSYEEGDAKAAFDSFMKNEPQKFQSVAESAAQLGTKLTEAMTNIRARSGSIASSIGGAINSNGTGSGAAGGRSSFGQASVR